MNPSTQQRLLRARYQAHAWLRLKDYGDGTLEWCERCGALRSVWKGERIFVRPGRPATTDRADECRSLTALTGRMET